MKIIISGGGTGGHIFPAISIANEIRRRYPDGEILFIGAATRMEMQRVPEAGYRIEGLPVSGFSRTSPVKNLKVAYRLLKSLFMARKLIKQFKPDAVVGVGGYASAPTLLTASMLGIPTLIQEQNSYAGITNKLLARNAKTICVAYRGMNRFFPTEKIVLTGNPVRKDLESILPKSLKAYKYFNLSPQKPVLLVIGGSLGARTINNSILNGYKQILNAGVQIIWQTGKNHFEAIKQSINNLQEEGLWVSDFVSRMDLAYSIADLVVSRAGAGTISELCLQAKPCILVPSPNVAEDHQTKNAMALVENAAALLLHDLDAEATLAAKVLSVINNKEQLVALKAHIYLLAQHNSAERIVNELIKICPAHISKSTSVYNVPQRTPKYISTDFLPERVYFIGAGGIGMSALIRYFLSKSVRVAGYDRTPSSLTAKLIEEGAEIHYVDDVSLIPDDFKLKPGDTAQKESTPIVYTPAVPPEHSELQYFQSNNYKVLKRAQVLGIITENTRAVCVAGTHGKTTTSSMTAHILKQSSLDCTAFLGGILKNYDSNLLLSQTSDLCVVEADEYDRSFHYLKPYISVVTSLDPDHLDIYGTPEAYRDSFFKFISLTRPNGYLLLKKEILDNSFDFGKLTAALEVNPSVIIPSYTYSMTARNADFYADNIRIGNGEIIFDFISTLSSEAAIAIKDVNLGVPVRINIENAVAAMAVAYLLGVSPEVMKKAVKSFQGAERRFDFKIKDARIVYIDDYAHHPEEILSSLRSIKELYPDKALTCVFQPHLYSRTKDFSSEFASALSLADSLILLDIYPAREDPIEGVSSELILDQVTVTDKTLCSKDELLGLLRNRETEVLVTLGAGDIDRLVNPITKLLTDKYLTK